MLILRKCYLYKADLFIYFLMYRTLKYLLEAIELPHVNPNLKVKCDRRKMVRRMQPSESMNLCFMGREFTHCSGKAVLSCFVFLKPRGSTRGPNL